MQDSIVYHYDNFDLTAMSNWFAVDVRRAQIWSVQAVAGNAWTSCTVEVLMSNDGITGVSFSPAQTLTAAGMITGIDAGGLGIGFLIVKITDNSSTSSEHADITIVGRTDNGTGVIERHSRVADQWVKG